MIDIEQILRDDEDKKLVKIVKQGFYPNGQYYAGCPILVRGNEAIIYDIQARSIVVKYNAKLDPQRN